MKERNLTMKQLMRLALTGSLLIAVSSVTSVACASDNQYAQQTGLKVEGYIGAGINHQSEYLGSKDFTTFATPEFSLTFNDRIFINTTNQLSLDQASETKPQIGAYLFNKPNFKLGIAATYESDPDKYSEPSIYGINAVSALDLRAFATIKIQKLELKARYSHVVSGSESQQLSLGALRTFKLRPKTYLTIFGSATWANQKAMNAYFNPYLTVDDGFGGSITARASDLVELDGGIAKRPKAGLKSMEAGLDLEYPLYKKMFLKLGASATYLSDNARGTPLTETDWVFGGNASVIYKF